MKLGDTFLMHTSASRFIRHLYIVISDPAKNAGNFIAVNITGDRFRTGEECVLDAGDHPWIKKKSFVAFADALEITPAHDRRLQKLIVSKKIVLQPSVSSEVLERIVTAAKVSTAIAENYKKYL